MNKNCERRRGYLPALCPSSSTRLHYDQHWYPGALCARLFNRQSSSHVGTPVACEVNQRALCGYCLRSLIRIIMWELFMRIHHLSIAFRRQCYQFERASFASRDFFRKKHEDWLIFQKKLDGWSIFVKKHAIMKRSTKGSRFFLLLSVLL